MGKDFFNDVWSNFSQRFSPSNLIVEGLWALLIAFASRLLAIAFGLKIENELLFWVFSSIGILLFLIMIKSLFGKDLEKPELKGYIDSWSVMKTDPKDVKGDLKRAKGSTVILIVSIKNAGMPTILDGWTVYMTLYNGEEFVGKNFKIPNDLTLVGDGGEMHFSGNDAIYNKFQERPLPKGGMVRGILMVIFEDITPELFVQPGNKLKFKFCDVYGKENLVENEIPAKKSTEILYYPGLSG